MGEMLEYMAMVSAFAFALWFTLGLLALNKDDDGEE